MTRLLQRRFRPWALAVAIGLVLITPVAGVPTVATAASATVSAAVSTNASTAKPQWRNLASGTEPEANPLKGFIPYAQKFTDFPHSMEWSYFPVNAVMKGPKTFDWTVVDKALRQISGRRHQTALRFYLDYPTKKSGIPAYLIKGGLETHEYTDFNNNGVSVSPNYEDPNLRAAMSSFIAALGKRYDGDPRIGFVQAGLLGFWGEWHTYPHNGENGMQNWFASDTVQKEVLTSYVSAFPHTQLEVRTPTAINASMPIGYHDDSFALETMRSSLGWHFMDLMDAQKTAEKWQHYSVGGELRPELQGCLFSIAGCAKIEDGGDNDFYGSLAQTHASWLLNQAAFDPGFTDSEKTRAVAASESLGYSFRATKVLLPGKTRAKTVPVGLAVTDTGVAPFYYPWTIGLAVVDSRGKVVRTATTKWKLNSIASGSTRQFDGYLDLGGLKAGRYRIVAQGTNPMAGGMPVRFSNATQDQDKNGWMTLGITRIVHR